MAMHGHVPVFAVAVGAVGGTGLVFCAVTASRDNREPFPDFLKSR